MNRGSTEAAGTAASLANDALVARAPTCPDCGNLLELGHLVGCAALPPPVPVELCAGETPTSSGHANEGGTEPPTAAALVGPPDYWVCDDCAGGGHDRCKGYTRPLPYCEVQCRCACGATPLPDERPDVDPVTGEVDVERLRTDFVAGIRRQLADLGPRPPRLIPDPPDVSDHEPGETKVGSRYRCAACDEFHPCSTIEKALAYLPTPDQLEALAMVDVGWSVERRTADPLRPRIPRGLVVGYRDDPDLGRTFTVLRFKGGFPTYDRIDAIDIAVEFVGPPNSKSTRDAYRGLAEWVGKRSGTADENEPRALATALALAQTVV
ncbi:MAG: hypothetical protein LC798_16940 [Chloroflexi bacterium]|nr:hypothetical protein [Chloroflexota bacterium]